MLQTASSFNDHRRYVLKEGRIFANNQHPFLSSMPFLKAPENVLEITVGQVENVSNQHFLVQCFLPFARQNLCFE